MVKHIIFWELNDGVDAQAAAADLRERFKGLMGVVDGLISIEVGVPKGDKPRLVLYSEFTSWEALDGYQVHPDHIAIKSVVHAIVCGRQCCDYEI